MKHTLRGILSIVLIIYLVFATKIANHMAANDVCTGMTIVVNDTSSHPFVTVNELNRELHNLPTRAKGMSMSRINTDSILHRLSRIDKIEHVSVIRHTDGSIIISVDPMRPIARIFDTDYSYYINREGKRISADARYHMDVPVIQGHFVDSVFAPTRLIPLLDYLDTHEKWGNLISMIKVASPSDVYLIPAIRGQVINFGSVDESTFDSKFKRLDRMYSEILPVKGWNYYDTISVKWNNQVVANRRDKSIPDNGYIVEENEEEVDISTMLAGDGVAPGQALAGKKAKNEKPIPASKQKSQQKEKADTAGVKKSTKEKSKDSTTKEATAKESDKSKDKPKQDGKESSKEKSSSEKSKEKSKEKSSSEKSKEKPKEKSETKSKDKSSDKPKEKTNK